ncbi:malonic semialdehyde reductase [Microbulbifer thermotolerans]|uniref:Putative NADH dehydrogenase/NAD(P)H nitroreductase A3224_08940 n=1 Tax=Microbulbifer thermotolerans TaxID=252514 RepID=A0A143HMD5_MICTH|nr:malonic semialdehyde reductase [Microbulbifer thermotolerans]AMX02691.1 nitroreductase family protein [Microbulbifer thermotolerans]MCX2782504.1 malonic semialdehyde reductase [Microbulbifer thermotolerans]MCX2794516.1 malonic semialdehyde reductase [Microbulbifer thermotolerans]MCX2802207.1 malonic semialdehyde reductase [Microbulbifer thermotolerans]MCX2836270.1 malonic semialdehyde reductase [Microbulbifer thermotolerans]
MGERLPEASLKQLFTEARTHSHWLDKPVSDKTLKQLYDLMKMGPTSANCCPIRIVFVKTKEGKERLKPALNEGNVQKTMAAPVTAIIAYDLKFYEYLPRLFPHAPARNWFVNNPELAVTTAFRNGSLQGGYFILAARSLGLDCGPMSGFDNAMVDREFFSEKAFGRDFQQECCSEGYIKSNFLCNLGYGDHSILHPRSRRFEFDEVCKIL